MLTDRTYCSRVSYQADEPQLATASRGTVWLLLEHPGPWGLEPPGDTPLPERAKQYLSQLLRTQPSSRLLLIKQEPRAAASIAFFVVVACEDAPRIYSFALASYEELPYIEVTALLKAPPAPDRARERKIFLVCTDGKHDICCAKFGLPIYRAVRSLGGAAVWQTSHVGGDRFAANVVCFPHGVFYGHVEPQDIQPLMEDYGRGRVYLPKYRGRSCYSFVEQAAEHFVRVETKLTAIDAFAFEHSARTGEQTWQVEFRSAADGRMHVVTVSRRMSAASQLLTCRSEQPQRVPQYRLLNYQVV